MSSVSFRIVALIWAHPGDVGFISVRSAHSCAPWGSLGSFGCALRVVGFIGFHLGEARGWSCSFWCVGFVRAHPGGRRVHFGSLCSFERVLGVVRFIRVRCVRSGAPWGSLGSIVGALVLSGSFGFVVFIQARRGSNRV